MKKTLSNMLDSDKSLELSRVTIPTSILWGADDTVTPPRQAEVMHKNIKYNTLSIHDGWTHAPYIAHPAELAKAIFRAYKNPPKITAPVEVTEASSISASMALKKAAEPEIPDTTTISATLAFKKAANPSAHDTVSRSAALAVPGNRHRRIQKTAQQVKTLPARNPKSIIGNTDELDFVTTSLPPLEPRQIISSASVPKVSRMERMRRKFQKKPQRKSPQKGKKS